MRIWKPSRRAGWSNNPGMGDSPALRMKRAFCIALSAALTGVCMGSESPPPLPASRDTFSDTWVATDGLGRSLPTHAETGGPRKDRFVGIFYFLWLGRHGDAGPFDISRILAADPDAMSRPDSPLWGPLHAPHHWGEPVFGYYVSDDESVLAKHAQMLVDAGVDTVIFDVTNQLTYPLSWQALCRVWEDIRRRGGHTPQIAFLCPFGQPGRVVSELYEQLYRPNLYSDLWFRWEGKPLILADPSQMKEILRVEEHDHAAELHPGQTLGQTFRAVKPFAEVGGCFPTWGGADSAVTLSLRRDEPGGKPLASHRFDRVTDNSWLMLTPENPLPPGDYVLEISEPEGRVGWWSHSQDTCFAHGKAMADGKPVAGDRNLRLAYVDKDAAAIRDFFTFRRPQASYFTGPQSPNEWGWLEIYPQHPFPNAGGEIEEVTVGVAQNALDGKTSVLSNPQSRGRSFHDGCQPGPGEQDFTGRNFAEQWKHAISLDPKFIFVTGWNEWIAGRFRAPSGFHGDGPVTFVDQFDREYSRDCEPMRGGHGDAFYMQLAASIRRFKGVRQSPRLQNSPIQIDGKFNDWLPVGPEFRDDIGDPVHRDHAGWAKGSRYVNTTGRNDIVASKVSVDDDYVHFYVRTRAPLTPPSDPHWMMLFIDADNNPQTGWMGYDSVVRKYEPGNGMAVLERHSGVGYHWDSPTNIRFCSSGNELELSVPRTTLASESPAFDFKWADNILETGEWSDFTLNGDAAPNDRFNYRALIPQLTHNRPK